MPHTTAARTAPTDAPAGTVCYDADCRLCTGFAERYRESLARRGFELAPLQAPDIAARLGHADGDLPDEMQLLRADGRILSGADAVLHLAEAIDAMRPLRWLVRLPGGMTIARVVYRIVARHRHRNRRRPGSTP